METAIYVRVSTEEQAQEGFSIRAQEQKLKDYARIKDWSIYNIYADEGISGKNLTERPAMQEMIADIKNGNVKNVLVFKIDRLTRSTVDLIYLVDLFNKYECSFNSLTESIDTQTASGRMFLKIIGIFAEFERENIIERTKVGIERKVKEGYCIGGQSSYGYNRELNQKVQTINNEEASTVVEIFDLFVNQRVSITDIARRLNIRKIPTKKNSYWNNTLIRRLLQNTNYIGQVRHHIHDKQNAYSGEGKHEAIIDKETFDMAQKLLACHKKTTPRKYPLENNYFSGLLVCEECGAKLATHNSYKKLRDGTISVTGNYRCRNKAVRVCNSHEISHSKMEKAFYEYISNIKDFDVTDELEIKNQKREQNDKLIKLYIDKLKHIEAKGKESLSHYVDGEIDFVSYREIKRLLDNEKKSISVELESLKQKENEPEINREDIITNLCENWSYLSKSERRQFLIRFIDRIVVKTEKIPNSCFVDITIKDISFKS